MERGFVTTRSKASTPRPEGEAKAMLDGIYGKGGGSLRVVPSGGGQSLRAPADRVNGQLIPGS